MSYIRLEREEWEGWDSFERRLERCPAKAIKNTENQIVYLIYGKDIKSGRIRDTNCGYKGGDYAFDNRDSTCLSDAIATYKHTHIRMPQWLHWICRKKNMQNSLKIEVDGPEKVIIKNYNGERQTKMEKFFNAWAAENVNYAKGRYITYWNYPDRRYIWLEYPGMDNLVWKELSDEETNKYIDLYNRADWFFNKWSVFGIRECHLDGYKIARSRSGKLRFSIALFEEESYDNMKKLFYGIEIRITTHKGISADAKHYCGVLDIFQGETSKHDKSELTRPITQAEIDADPDRFYCYDEGKATTCFNTWRDVVCAGKDKVLELGLTLEDVIVTGIPNNKEMLLEKALNNDIDTRLKCSRCGSIITGIIYNLPSGVICNKCHNGK